MKRFKSIILIILLSILFPSLIYAEGMGISIREIKSGVQFQLDPNSSLKQSDPNNLNVKEQNSAAIKTAVEIIDNIVSGNEAQCDILTAIQSDPNGFYVRIKNGGSRNPYTITHTSIDPNTSVNFSFGFTSKEIHIYADQSNTEDIVIDWLGSTAVAPSADTAGDERIPPGMVKALYFNATSISAISNGAAGTGTQTLSISAY